MGLATAIGLGASVIGGVLGSKKQNKIAQQQADATTEAADKSAAVQRQNFLDTAALNMPRMQAGDVATAQMLQLMGLPVPETLTSGAAYGQIMGGGVSSGGVNGMAGASGLADGGGAFNANAYYQANPDVKNALSGLTQDDWKWVQKKGYTPDAAGFAQYHWDTYGKTEGRNLGLNKGGAMGAGGGAGGANSLAGASGYGFELSPVGSITDTIKATPGYQFRFNEGINAVDSSAANRGMLLSGSQMRRLQEFGDDYAAQEFGNYWNRLGAIASGGQVATQGTTAASANTANNLSSIYQNAGQGLATSYGNQTSTAANTLGMVGGGLMQYYG